MAPWLCTTELTCQPACCLPVAVCLSRSFALTVFLICPLVSLSSVGARVDCVDVVQKAASVADAHGCPTTHDSGVRLVYYSCTIPQPSLTTTATTAISLCLPRNIDYIQCCASSFSLCIAPLCRAARAACCCCSHLAYCRPSTVHSAGRIFTHPGPSNLQRIALTYTLVVCECGVGIPRETTLHECIAAAAAKTTSIFIRLPEPRPR